jgi:hypothetical protein
MARGMADEALHLVGHDCPLGRYPAPIVPIVERAGSRYAVYSGATGHELVDIAAGASFVRHDAQLAATLEPFVHSEHRLFGFAESDVERYPVREEPIYFARVLASSRLPRSDCFMRLTLAKATSDSAPLLDALSACLEHVLARNGRLSLAWATKQLEELRDDTRVDEAHALLSRALPDLDQPRFEAAASNSALLDELREFARCYETIRSGPKGEERTSRMHVLINALRRRLERVELAAELASDLFAEGAPGQRVVALTCWDVFPNAAPMRFVVEGICSPRSGFEQWRALIAAKQIAIHSSPEHAEGCVGAMLQQWDNPDSLLNEPGDGSRRAVAKLMAEPYVRKLGLQGMEAIDLAREWIRAGRRERHTARRVLVLGTDPGRDFAGVAERLGSSLAAHGWTVLADASLGHSLLGGFRHAGSSPDARLLIGNTAFERADLVIAIAGDASDERQCARCLQHGTAVVPVAFTGGAAARLAPGLRDLLEARGIPVAFLQRLASVGEPASAAECIVRILNLLASPPAPSGAGTLRHIAGGRS